jgi:hypothetical protein
MDAETAYAEAVRAVGDPAWGLGTLVLYELRALESALARAVTRAMRGRARSGSRCSIRTCGPST